MDRESQERLYVLSQTLTERQQDDPLLGWEAFSKQRAFIDSILEGSTTEAWAICANRAGKCLTPWTPVETGSATRLPLELLGEEAFDVRTWDGESRCTNRASGLFLKDIAPVIRIYLDNGQAFDSTYRHRVLTPSGWSFVGSLLSIQADRHWKGRRADYRANYDTALNLYDLSLLPLLSTYAITPQQLDDVQRQLLIAGIWDASGPTLRHIHAYLGAAPLSTVDDPARLLGLFSLWDNCFSYPNDRLGCDLYPFDGRPFPESSPGQEVAQSGGFRDHSDFAASYYSLSYQALLFGGVKIIGYQKLGLRPIVDWTVDKTHSYYSCGVLHHNSDAGSYIGSHMARFGPPVPKDIYMGDIVVRDRATYGWVSGLDFPTLRGTLQPKYFDNGYASASAHPPFIPDREVKEWRPSDQLLKLKNGSIIEFRSAESGRAKYQGAEKDWIHLDEEHPKDIYDEISIRVGNRQLYIFCTATLLPPDGVNSGGVSWAFSDIIQPFQRGEVLKEDLMCFGWSIYDNPHIPEEIIRKLEAKYDPTSAQGRIRLGGEWLPGMGGARAYTKFSNGLHVQPQREFFNPHLPLCWIWDFNVEPMVSLVGQRDRRIFRVFREFWLDEGSIPDMIQCFYDSYPRHSNEIWIYGDATGKFRSKQSNASDYNLILNGLRAYGVPVRLKIPETNPWVNDRINAVNYALGRETGEVGIQVDPSCRELLADFEGVLRDKKGGIKKVTNRKDPYFYRTHMSDAFGYWVAYEEPVRVETKQKKKLKVKTPSYGLN